MPTEKTVIEFSAQDFEKLSRGEEINLDGNGTYIRADPDLANDNADYEANHEEPPEPPQRERSVGELDESTQLYDFAIHVANHPKEWVTSTDIDNFFADTDAESPTEKLASNHLGDLYRKGVCERNEDNFPYEYRLKEWYKREFSQYDDLNGGV